MNGIKENLPYVLYHDGLQQFNIPKNNFAASLKGNEL